MGRFKVSLRDRGELPVDRLERSLELLSAAGNQVLPAILNAERDTPDIATEVAPVLGAESSVFGSDELPAVKASLSEVQDRRLFHPDSVQPNRTIRGSRASLKASAPSAVAPNVVPHGITFSNSASVIICVRRFARRAVILASGKGGGSHADPVRTPDSDIWCYDGSNARRNRLR